VTTAAVKLARAFTGRKIVAFPSDHPFYSYDDWFIGKTACPRGVPEEFQSLSVTFKSYDIKSLEQLFDQYPDQIACVITEPQKHVDIPNNYLQEAIDLCHKNGALFIADEMVTGFKAGLPGVCAKFGVTPDMSTWGKATANGFSFCALTGKKEIMNLGGVKEKGQKFVFLISSTHGGETTGLAAVNATIDFYLKNNVLNKNISTGQTFLENINKIITKHKMEKYIDLVQCNWLPIFQFKDLQSNISKELRTLFLQEMIKRGILFQGCLVPSFAHNKTELDLLSEAFEDSIPTYIKALEEGTDKYLIGEACGPVFREYI
ncbi:MAG: aminotransferase class III-fold pyridoxal phosphate-dependent enzyme, partial [Bacteriovorax sp.]|nr:aminotransferase class III-fold pyridoxal phosphate-dependent enzyme [Bacteriovorax sp.]